MLTRLSNLVDNLFIVQVIHLPLVRLINPPNNLSDVHRSSHSQDHRHCQVYNPHRIQHLNPLFNLLLNLRRNLHFVRRCTHPNSHLEVRRINQASNRRCVLLLIQANNQLFFLLVSHPDNRFIVPHLNRRKCLLTVLQINRLSSQLFNQASSRRPVDRLVFQRPLQLATRRLLGQPL